MTLNGTAKADHVNLTREGDTVVEFGLPTITYITGSEAANDTVHLDVVPAHVAPGGARADSKPPGPSEHAVERDGEAEHDRTQRYPRCHPSSGMCRSSCRRSRR